MNGIQGIIDSSRRATRKCYEASLRTGSTDSSIFCQPIGSGAHGSVDLYMTPSGWIARKTFDVTNNESLESLRREMQFCQSPIADHENFVKCHRVLECGRDQWCIDMPFIPGGSGKDFIEHHRIEPIPQKTIVCIISQLLAAVETLDSNGYNMNDISKDNIGLEIDEGTDVGGNPQLKARVLDPGCFEKKTKRPPCGKPAYSETVNNRTVPNDLRAVQVFAWELLTANDPTAPTFTEVRERCSMKPSQDDRSEISSTSNKTGEAFVMGLVCLGTLAAAKLFVDRFTNDQTCDVDVPRATEPQSEHQPTQQCPARTIGLPKPGGINLAPKHIERAS